MLFRSARKAAQKTQTKAMVAMKLRYSREAQYIREQVETGKLGQIRSEERRVGKEGRSRWWPYHEKKKKKTERKRERHEERECRDKPEGK
mgnify:CR=1 FL=1